MKLLNIIDDRLAGTASKGSMVLHSRSITLSQTINKINQKVKDKKGIKYLNIYCHGMPSGLQFSKSNITLGNFSEFGKLSSQIQHISIFACRAAYKSNWKICQGIAKYAKCTVSAATAIQIYRITSNGYDFGEREGNVILFYPSGKTKKLKDDTNTDYGQTYQILTRDNIWEDVKKW